MACSGKSRRRVLDLYTKYHIIRACEDEGVRKSDIGRRYGINLSTLFTILKNREKIMNAIRNNRPGDNKRLRNAEHGEVERQLYRWVCEQKASGVAPRGLAIKAQAEEIARTLKIPRFKCSDGWLFRFKKRNGLLHSKEFDASDSSCYFPASSQDEQQWPTLSLPSTSFSEMQSTHNFPTIKSERSEEEHESILPDSDLDESDPSLYVQSTFEKSPEDSSMNHEIASDKSVTFDTGSNSDITGPESSATKPSCNCSCKTFQIVIDEHQKFLKDILETERKRQEERIQMMVDLEEKMRKDYERFQLSIIDMVGKRMSNIVSAFNANGTTHHL